MNDSIGILSASCAALVWLAACGESHPVPGDAGSRADASMPAATAPFCENRGRVECERRMRRGEIDDAERAACIAAVPAMCTGFAWATGCTPSQAEADACIDALRNLANLNRPFDTLPECNLCP